MMSKFDQLVRGSQEEKTSWWQLTHRALVDDASSTDVEEESSVGTEVQWASQDLLEVPCSMEEQVKEKLKVVLQVYLRVNQSLYLIQQNLAQPRPKSLMVEAPFDEG